MASLGACSSESPSAAAGRGGGPGGGTGGSSVNAGGASAGTAGSDSSQKDVSVGMFSVLLNEAELSAPAFTSVSGKVYDGETPSQFIETKLAESAGCTVYKLKVPFCDPDCVSGVCVADDKCQPNPTVKNVGTVTVSGVATTAGEKTFPLKAVSNSYKTSGDVTLAYPGFSAGDPITVSASGGDYSAFTITASGVEPLTLGTDDYELTKTTPLALAWSAPANPSNARIQVEINLSHHGGSTGYISCDVPDSGALTIGADLIGKLIDLGVAGGPTLTVTRTSRATTTIAPGRVVLNVASQVRRTISVQGYISCTTDDDCQAAGKRCDMDFRLCK